MLPLRMVVSVAVLVSAVVHFWLWYDVGFDQIPVIGPAFLVNAVAGVVICVAVFVWKHWFPALLAAGFGGVTFGAFVISATVGLYGVREPWWGTWQIIANASELIALLGGLVLLRGGDAEGGFAT